MNIDGKECPSESLNLVYQRSPPAFSLEIRLCYLIKPIFYMIEEDDERNKDGLVGRSRSFSVQDQSVYLGESRGVGDK